MQFENFAAFLDMGGHGLYVWLCYGVALLILTMNLIAPGLQRRNLIRELQQRMRREHLSNGNSSDKPEVNSHAS